MSSKLPHWRAYVPPRATRRVPFPFWIPPVADHELATTAYHEAGHAVLQFATTRMGPYRITVERTRAFLGESRYKIPKPTCSDDAALDAAVSLAGPIAEHLWCDGAYPEDLCGLGDVVGDSDLSSAFDLLVRWFPDVDDVWWRVCRQLRIFLNRRRQRLAVGRVVRLLHQYGTLENPQLAGIWKPEEEGFVPADLSFR